MSMGISNIDDRPVVLIQERLVDTRPLVIQEEAKKYGWRLFNLYVTDNVLPKGLKPIGALIRDGIDSTIGGKLTSMNVPFVRVGDFPSYYGFDQPSVTVMRKNCGRIAAKYFLDNGFLNLAYIGNDPWGNAKEIYEQFAETAKELGGDCYLHKMKGIDKNQVDIETGFSKHSKEIGEWLHSLPKPVGLFSYNDKMASRFCAFCIEAGLRVPQDVSILGIGNSSFLCETAPIPLSSIQIPWGGMWRTAFKLLNDLIEGEKEVEEVLFLQPSGVVERQSTDVIPIKDPMVVEAVQYIWDNYHKDISVEDFIKTVRVSRSTIQRGFQKCLGRGFNEELRRKRLEVAQRYLLNTDWTINDIASRVGFNSRNYFHRSFISAYEHTPSDYRKVFRN